MQNIVKNTADNLGALYTFYFIPVSDVSSIPEAVNKNISSPVSLNASKAFYSAQVTLDSLSYKESENQSDEGSSYNIQLGGFVAGDSSNLSVQFEEMSLDRFILIAEDNNGKKRLVGTLNNPLRFKADFDTSSKFSGLKGWNILFYQTFSDSEGRPPFYLSSFTAYPLSESVEINDLTSILARLNIIEDELDSFEDAAISDIAYAISWNGITNIAPSKNAVYDMSLGLLDLAGTRAMTGDLDLGGNNINNVSSLSCGTIYDEDFNAHITLEAGDISIDGNNITASRILILDASKKIISSGVTSATLNFLDATSSVQTQLNSKLTSANISDTVYGGSWDGVTTIAPSKNAIYDKLETMATKAYADALILGLLNDRGNYDASGNTYPATGGSGSAGAILKGDLWTISVAGTLGGTPVTAGDVVRSLSNTPGQTSGNWAIGENNFGYVALNQALADGKIYIGNGSGIGTAVTPSGDITISNAGVTSIGSGKVTNTMLAGSIAASKLVGTDITTVGTIGAGSWQGSAIADAYISSSSTWNAKQAALVSGTNIKTVNGSSLLGSGDLVVNSSQWTTTGSDIYYNTGNVMIGAAAAPLVKLHVAETGTSTLRGASIDQYNVGTNGARLFLRKSRGTYASPNTTIVVGDLLGTLFFSGNDGSNFLDMGGIRVTSVGTVANTRVPTKMEFMTGTNAAPSVLTTALTLDESQNAQFSGNITSGTWQGSIVTGTYGGTGVNNASKTITLGGNLVTTGAFNLTLSVPQTTTYTLPNTASETLAGLGTIQTFSAIQTFSGGFGTGASVSTVYRLTNAGSNVTGHAIIDPAGTVSVSGSLAYAFSTADGLIFTHANGTRRIRGWSAILTNLVNTAGSESSDITWTPQNVTDKFIVGGAVNFNQLTGTTSRIIEVDSSGNMSATEDIIPWLFSNATDQTNITTRSNWSNLGVYSGTAMGTAQQAQWYNDSNYLYGMLDNSTPFNVPRFSRYKVIYNSVTTTGTPASTVETDLFTYTVPASTLATDLEMIDGTAAGTFATGVTTKDIKVYFGGTVILDTGALGFNNGQWAVEFDIIRESATVVRCNVRFTSNLATLSAYAQYTRITGLTLSNTNILKITGTAGIGAAANDATGNMFKASWQSVVG